MIFYQLDSVDEVGEIVIEEPEPEQQEEQHSQPCNYRECSQCTGVTQAASKSQFLKVCQWSATSLKRNNNRSLGNNVCIVRRLTDSQNNPDSKCLKLQSETFM